MLQAKHNQSTLIENIKATSRVTLKLKENLQAPEIVPILVSVPQPSIQSDLKEIASTSVLDALYKRHLLRGEKSDTVKWTKVTLFTDALIKLEQGLYSASEASIVKIVDEVNLIQSDSRGAVAPTRCFLILS